MCRCADGKCVHFQITVNRQPPTVIACRQASSFNNNNMGENISIAEAQNMVDEWIRTTGVRYFNELTNMAILTEEVGEVARLMSRIYGDQSFREVDKDKKLSDELADVLWVILCIANQTGTDLTAALKKNFDKKKHPRCQPAHCKPKTEYREV